MALFRRPLLRGRGSGQISARETAARETAESSLFRYAMLSHPGRIRKGNEDTCAADRTLGAFVVCDGMGGAAAGEIASRLAAEEFLAAFSPARGAELRAASNAEARLAAAVAAANSAVWSQAMQSAELRGMGTTLVALLIETLTQRSLAPGATEGEREAPVEGIASLTLVHVGDSRCYRFRAGELTLLTQDHSLVGEQVRLGELTASEAEHHPMRNIITRAVGSQPDVQPDILQLDPLPGDLYLLASDGLTRDLNEDDLQGTITQSVLTATGGRPDLLSLAETLIDQANEAGGGDNISVLLVQLS